MEKRPFRIFFSTKTDEQERKPVVAKEEKDQGKGMVSTELSLWYGVSTETDKANGSESSSSVRIRKRTVSESTNNVATLTKDDANNIARTKTKLEEVSTELKLDLSNKDSQRGTSFLVRVEIGKKEMERRIRSFRFYSYKDEEEERRLGVSTKLKLFEDPWKIKKRLTRSDTNGMCGLMLSRDVVEANIIPFWDVDQIAGIETEAGARVIVWDYETGSAHQLAFKKWPSNPNCIFNKEWSIAFVHRRCLHEGDMIGLFWDTNNLRFGFRLLARASGN
ncbi:hypothetical protein F0562_007442 [Nyssa sinensis]|uniref:TF-B3 domain-containing protein n=1 Tax=Nyssa sinensis TaxID=561372 RepID=A0A5J5A882_9ASTE|nr:hypothetical protein F0562_007442 [Nyssa sinensis]